MKVLVTAGNTLVPIDRVRCLTNIFTGRTGAQIAAHGHARGHAVTLLTSHPEAVAALAEKPMPAGEHWSIQPYRTFDELKHLLGEAIRPGNVDAIIHAAAVADYRVAGTYAPAPGTQFRPEDSRWLGTPAGPPTLLDRAAAKIKSDEPELWLRLVRTPKLVDQFRRAWGFRGLLVKFKLEVGVSDVDLLEIAERSRLQSAADLMVANTLEGAATWAYLGPLDGRYERVPRQELAPRLFDALEQCRRGSSHG